MKAFRFIRSQVLTALPLFLCAQMVVLPVLGQDPDCDPVVGSPASDLASAVNDAAIQAKGPCMFMESGEIPAEYKKLLEDANRQLAVMNQPIITATGTDTRPYWRQTLNRSRGILRGIARRFEKDLADAGNDCERFANLQTALAAYYMGPLQTFHSEYVSTFKNSPGGFTALRDLYVQTTPQVAGQLSGTWKARLDPVEFAKPAPLLRYNPMVEQMIDIGARAEIGDEQRYLESLQLQLASAELANYATLDSLLDDGGKAPCVPAALKNKFMSLREPNRIVENRRWIEREADYRNTLLPAVHEAMAKTTPLATGGLLDALKAVDPTEATWATKFFTDKNLGDLAALEQAVAPQILSQLLAQEATVLSSMNPEARSRRLAELATQARAGVITQYIDSVLKAWEQQEAGVEDSAKFWTGYNTEDKRKARLNALMTPMRANAAEIATAINVPAVPRYEFGAKRQDYANAVIPVALAAADLEDQSELVKRGAPPSDVGLGVMGTGSANGVAVEALIPGSVAQTAGILAGDTITHINGTPVTSASQADALLKNKYGSAVQIQITRNEQPMVAQAELAVRVSPRLSWQILFDDFMDCYPMMEDQVPDNWFRRNVPGVSLNYQTRYGEEGSKAAQEFSQIITSGKPFNETQLDYMVALSNQTDPALARQMRAMGTRIGLDGATLPTMERVLRRSDEQGKVFLDEAKQKVMSLPIVSQTVTWNGQTFMGMDWINPDDEATFFHMAQSAAQDRVNFYKMVNGRLRIDKEKLAAYLPADQVDRVARDMQRIVDQTSARSTQVRTFNSALNARASAFTRLDNAREQYLEYPNPEPTGHMGYSYTMPEYQSRMNELRTAVTGTNMTTVRKKLDDYWHDYMSSGGYGPHRSLAHTLEYVVRKATQGEQLTNKELKYLRDHVKRQKDNWGRTMGYSRQNLQRAISGIGSLADSDSVNAGLFNWSGDPVNANAKRIMREFSRDKLTEVSEHFSEVDELGKNMLDSLDKLLNDRERLGKHANLNEALMQELPVGALAETAASLRRGVDQDRVHSYVRNAETNLQTVTDRLVRNNPALANMHTQVRDRLNEGMVEAAVRAAIDDVCKTLENIADQDDVEDMRENLMAAVIRQAVLQQFPNFEKTDGESEAAFHAYQGKWQTITHITTSVVITALVISYFIPGVNLATGAATPYIAGGTAALFAAEAGWGAYNYTLLHDRADFSRTLGTATYNGIRIQDPGVTEAMASEGNSEAMWAGLDLLFVGLEAYRVVKWVRFAKSPAGQAAREMDRARKLLKTELGIGKNPTKKELHKAWVRWAAKNHPDKLAGQSQAVIDAATKKFQEMSSAVDKLKAMLENVPPPPDMGPLALPGPR